MSGPIYKSGAWMIEPTDAERQEMADRRAEAEAESRRRRTATRLWLLQLDKITDPLAVKILALHHRHENYPSECAECQRDECGNADWPCSTVLLVAEHCGYPAPEWVEL